MKSIGVVRKTDSLGRIVIPKEVRDSLGWEERESIEMFTEGDTVILRSLDDYAKKQEVIKTLEEIVEKRDSPMNLLKINDVIEYLKGNTNER